jgi:hypothetical protein
LRSTGADASKAFLNHSANGETLFPGTDIMIFKIFSPKNSAKKLAFLMQNKAKLCKTLIITLVFEKTPIFFVENCRKSTPTPGHFSDL